VIPKDFECAIEYVASRLPLLLNAINPNIHLLIIKAHVPRNSHTLRRRIPIIPNHILIHLPVRDHIIVLRGALIRTQRQKATGPQHIPVDARRRDISSAPQRRLEQEQRRRRLGQHDAAELDAHAPRRRQDVDPLVRVPRVPVHGHVFFEDLLQRLQVELDEVGQRGRVEDDDAVGCCGARGEAREVCGSVCAWDGVEGC
jgi:hypothetical protein